MGAPVGVIVLCVSRAFVLAPHDLVGGVHDAIHVVVANKRGRSPQDNCFFAANEMDALSNLPVFINSVIGKRQAADNAASQCLASWGASRLHC